MNNLRCLMRMAIWASALAVGAQGCAAAKPALLKGVAAGGGFAFLCSESDVNSKPDESSELTQRLRTQFPPGTQESRLTSELTKEGFVFHVRESPFCPENPAVREAHFSANGFPASTEASIRWKANAAHRLVWTDGVVEYDAP